LTSSLNIDTVNLHNNIGSGDGEESMYQLRDRIAENMWNDYQVYINHYMGLDN